MTYVFLRFVVQTNLKFIKIAYRVLRIYMRITNVHVCRIMFVLSNPLSTKLPQDIITSLCIFDRHKTVSQKRIKSAEDRTTLIFVTQLMNFLTWWIWKIEESTKFFSHRRLLLSHFVFTSNELFKRFAVKSHCTLSPNDHEKVEVLLIF